MQTTSVAPSWLAQATVATGAVIAGQARLLTTWTFPDFKFAERQNTAKVRDSADGNQGSGPGFRHSRPWAGQGQASNLPIQLLLQLCVF